MSASVADVLVAEGLITADQFAAAQTTAGALGTPVLAVLVQQGAVAKKDVVRCTVEAAGLEFVEVMDVTIDPAAAQLLTGDQARKYEVIPLALDHDVLVVVSDPQTAMDWQVRDDLQAITRHPVRFACGLKSEIQARINLVYRAEAELGELVRDMLDEDAAIDILAPVASTTDAPLVRYVNLLLKQAISDNASDIHLEPLEKRFRIRYRIDGVCHEIKSPPKRLQASIISRLKIMSNMSIAERRIPQDGRIQCNVGNKVIDLRVSCLPTNHGESIVMRILDKEGLRLGLGELGFFTDDQQTFERMISMPDGILLVTGPTGSGKTTTLYSCLNYINRPDRKIITVEDPVEYQLSGINQVQVSEAIGFTFGQALRSMLRQAPNIIMLGEIRDMETATIAINASLTGHLVFSTLHTNDAPSAVTRLIDIGIKPFLVGSALECATGQRLARRLCLNCRRQVEKTPDELAAIGFEYPPGVTPAFYESVGCSSCARTGYRGRLAMHEVMPMTEEIAKLAVRNASSEDVRRTAVEQGMRTLRQDGWLKVSQGLTTVAEVLRVVA
jgi:type IV pilus assembly protein PilB